MPSALIGPLLDGIRKDVKPFALFDSAFTTLLNAYNFRGRLIKRPGYTVLGRLANGTPVMGLRTQEGFGIQVQNLIAFDTTDSYIWNGTAFVTLPSVMTTTWSGTDYNFFWTINYANSFWATNSKAGLHGVSISSAVAGVGITTITTASPHGFTTGQTVVLINIGGMPDLNANTYVITVTGANTFTIPFQSAGAYTSGGIALNSYVSQANQDGIRYYGDLTNGTGWANYNPPIDPNNALAGALLIFAYRGYLVFLNTWEGNEQDVFNYPNRARWTQIGTPYYSPPAPVNPNIFSIDPKAARDDLFGRGGANDAPTNEVIVAAGFVGDILMVKFERSTWRLRFVNNTQNPFVWERINASLGSDCTFSAINWEKDKEEPNQTFGRLPFEKGLMSVSNRGISIGDINNEVRFDEKIPDEIFNIRQANFGLERVYGIRSFRTRLCYWTFPSADNPEGTYPDQVLVFNYDNKTWAVFDDCFTCFGYYYESSPGFTWGDLTKAWSSYTNVTWDSGVSQQGYENIVAGNQQGYVMVLEQTNGQNDPNLSISAITNGVSPNPATFTSADNNLPDGTWITLSGITGTTGDDGVSLNGRNFKLSNPTQDPDDFTLQEFEPINGGTATGTSYTYTIAFQYIFPGSVQINVGSLVYTDPSLDGVLVEAGGGGSGTIDYSSGLLTLSFNAPIAATTVYIRVVTSDPLQGLITVNTTGVYGGGGEIARISGFDIQSKIFNFFNLNQKSRISYVDFYTDNTKNGQFTCNVFADSSNVPVNVPLSDNLWQNIVLTSPSPYQIGAGDEGIFRLYCDGVAQTLQLQFTLTDQQLAINAINQSDMQLLAFMVNMRGGGRQVI